MRLLILLVAAACCCRAAGTGKAAPRVAALLPAGRAPLRLFPHAADFDDSSKVCTAAEVLRATFLAFSLPTDGPHLSLLLHLSALDCAAGEQGVLLGLGDRTASATAGSDTPAVDVSVDCGTGRLLLTSPDLGALVYQLLLPSTSANSAAGGLALLLTQDRQRGSFAVCVDGRELTAMEGGSEALLEHLGGEGGSVAALLGSAVVLGARSDAARSARADLAAAYLADTPLHCNATAPGAELTALLQQLADGAASEAAQLLPTAVVQQHPAAAVVGEPLTLMATANSSAGDALRMRLTFFGLSPQRCTAAECGDRTVEAPSTAPGQPATLSATVAYPKSGRYVVRVDVTSMRGRVTTHDHALLVRKRGDPALVAPGAAGAAPCCRHTPGAVAQQLGRPISDTDFRSTTSAAQAAALGWPADVWKNEDLEAERLFDYGVLAPSAPAPSAVPLSLTTCQDTRLAGAGSPRLYGTVDALASHTLGRNKRLAFVPAGYDWATSTDQIACQKHWSGWQQSSPHTLPAGDGSGGLCSTVCTREGTLQLMAQTGMFEQYNQALIAASYGALSLSADVAVLPEVYLPYRSDAPDNFSYYETPAVEALAAAGVTPWMYLVLVPLAEHRVPPFRAWSGGRASGGAVITQCFPTMYYAVHETGHRLGFRHANMYRLNGAVTAPTDPLGAGETTTSGYSDQLDVMACCKGDYGLFYRASAGWLRGGPAERAVLGPAELRAPGQRRLTLWPFDRPESRGNLLALSIRRSENEVLLFGFRSAPHWQDVAVEGGSLSPADSRHNVRGLTVELVRRDPSSGQWADHKGLLDFNVLSGDWPDALPEEKGGFPRAGAFAALKEGTAWHDPATGLLLSFEAVGACTLGTPGLPLYNHSALGFYGYRGEWPFHEAYERADYTGFQGLECAQLVLTTAAQAPKGRLEFQVEVAPPATTTTLSSRRRRLAMQPLDTSTGQVATGAQQPVAAACGVPAAPTLRLRLPAGQRLASVIWKDSLNRTVHVEDAASLAAAATAGAGAATWTTAGVALPPLYPLSESSADGAPGCSARDGACQLAARTYTALLLAPDGRYSRAEVRAAAPSLAGQQLSVRHKHYELHQLTYEQHSLTLPLGWRAASEGNSAPAGVTLFDAAATRAQPLLLAHCSAAVVAGSSLPSSTCSKQWTLALQLGVSGAALAAAARQAGGQMLLSVDDGCPALALGPSHLPSDASTAAAAALWLHWGPDRRRLALPFPTHLASAADSRQQQLSLVLVRDGSRLGLWANGQGGWLVRNLACVPSRPSITYCDRAPDTSTDAFRPPGELRLGAAAAASGGVAADAALTRLRFYSYALPEGDLAAEAAARQPQLQQYFRLRDGEQAGSEVLVQLVSPPAQQDGGSSGNSGGGSGLPGAMLGAAAGGGLTLVAAAAGGIWWFCRRRRLQREQHGQSWEAALQHTSADSVKSSQAAAGKASGGVLAL